jgi:hypothetical protein
MRWVGETRDSIQEALFHLRRDLFTEFTLAFFDTTSIYFEERGERAWGSMGIRRITVPICTRWLLVLYLQGRDGQ